MNTVLPMPTTPSRMGELIDAISHHRHGMHFLSAFDQHDDDTQAAQFADNLHRLRAREPLLNLVDRQRGY